MDASRYSKILGAGREPRFDPDMWSIRVNTLKTKPDDMREVLEESGYKPERIPWTGEGFWIKTGDILTKLDDHRDGHFFSQSASSMIPPIVLDPSPDDLVLDMAASPGSKTTQMAAMMGNEGAIIANDVDNHRVKILKINLQRCGVINTATAINHGQDIWKSGLKFDKILLDAPCTGTGTMNPRILRETSERTVEGFAKRQMSMIRCEVPQRQRNPRLLDVQHGAGGERGRRQLRRDRTWNEYREDNHRCPREVQSRTAVRVGRKRFRRVRKKLCSDSTD